ncbi:AGAP001496-PA-like protein [Anopheles sinensis]|uniref:AGAP001496-PA-like protein n=1 Tax=Anopheles sinensis TaxID=74873 RepID=A0A084W553_ANOSI|nr:AGAP001496-PA-like protein [Anopheles sinensis]
MDVPSMVRRSGDKLIVRQVVSGQEQELLGERTIKTEVKIEPSQQQQLVVDSETLLPSSDPAVPGRRDGWKRNGGREQLPQCKVKRNYSCPSCAYGTQNPRRYLTHLRDTHGEKISINECQRCLYASKHHQKLVRHMRMVHGTVEPASRATVKREEFSTVGTDNADHLLTTVNAFFGQLAPSEWNTQYGQQLVASDLQGLLKQLANSWNSSIAGNYLASRANVSTCSPTNTLPCTTGFRLFVANTELVRSALKIEMDHNAVNTSDMDTLQVGEPGKNVRRSMEENELTPRKRPRPIPNLIPLASPPTVAVRPEKDLLKPVPMSLLMPQENSTPECQQSASNAPTNLTPIVLDPQMKCTFCELSYATTSDLANHIEAAHKEDLFTSLLQKSIDETQQNLFPQSETCDGASNEVWKSLLELGYGGSESAASGQANEQDGKQSTHATEDDDVEILESRTETYCGIETAPGYGEVTSKLPTSDANAPNTVTKKVFKCPHCSFWASTASRFHVHIVGHLNKKPFECSLCSYRSNWRWDITKHIRLKTIRDPSHKNAGVLMNDETGRRNYTKYNKYITLMQIADNSVKEPVTYPKPTAENTISDLIAACSTYNIDLKAFANIPGYKTLLTKQMGDEVPSGNDPKQPGNFHLKCHLCGFRASSNEELLLHTTTSHAGQTVVQLQDDVIESDASGAPPRVESNTPPQPRNCTPVNIVSGAPNPVALGGSLSKSAANPSGESSTNGTPLLLTTTSGAGDRTNPLEAQGPGGEGGEGAGSQRMPVPTWRHNAPYRCGHCHQVSNWKHVIQRHCRLKHNGNVLIEHINSERDDPSDGEGGGQAQRHTRQIPNSIYVVDEGQLSNAASNDSLSVPTTIAPPPLAPFNCDELGFPVGSTLEPIVEIFDKDPADLVSLVGDSSTVLVSSGTVAPAVPGEQLYCVSCQFHAESVEQLTEHLEAHISNGQQREDSYNIAPTTLLDPVPTVMFYCSKCPARFFDRCHVVEHEERHACGASKSQPRRTANALTETVERTKQQEPRRSVDTASIGTDQPPLRSIFLCEYCDNAFDAESDLNAHTRNHFSAILGAQNVAYYTSLNSALHSKEQQKVELVVTGTQSTLPLHYAYDNTRRKEWTAFSKTDSVLLKL